MRRYYFKKQTGTTPSIIVAICGDVNVYFQGGMCSIGRKQRHKQHFRQKEWAAGKHFKSERAALAPVGEGRKVFTAEDRKKPSGKPRDVPCQDEYSSASSAILPPKRRMICHQ